MDRWMNGWMIGHSDIESLISLIVQGTGSFVDSGNSFGVVYCSEGRKGTRGEASTHQAAASSIYTAPHIGRLASTTIAIVQQTTGEIVSRRERPRDCDTIDHTNTNKHTHKRILTIDREASSKLVNLSARIMPYACSVMCGA